METVLVSYKSELFKDQPVFIAVSSSNTAWNCRWNIHESEYKMF